MGAETGPPPLLPGHPPISTHSARGGGDDQGSAGSSNQEYFNPLRPWGRRPAAILERTRRIYFNPLRPWGRRRMTAKRREAAAYFNPLRPWGRRRSAKSVALKIPRISTHSARGGGDDRHNGGRVPDGNFNPLRPWGRRPGGSPGRRRRRIFQPTPPVGAETCSDVVFLTAYLFQPTPPVGAETRSMFPPGKCPWISTHSARGGGDPRPRSRFLPTSTFQPTPPVGAETL